MQIAQILEQNKIFIMTPAEVLKIVFGSDESITKSLCGAWKDKRTAEEIIKDIYNSRLIPIKIEPKL